MTFLALIDQRIAAEHDAFWGDLTQTPASWPGFWLTAATHDVRLGRLYGIRAHLPEARPRDAQIAAQYRESARKSLARAEEPTGVPA
ncbi:MAG TPA: hypothetical protein VHX38_02325 [Pseudonocardiaceae bacterium]|jgi:hypothetical protein|nr:hypothetical protein [Pseudonocardiaceae bacterium]